MGFLRITAAIICVLLGFFLSITIIGAIFGIPLLIIGIYLGYQEKMSQGKKMVREGVKAALKEREDQKKETEPLE